MSVSTAPTTARRRYDGIRNEYFNLAREQAEGVVADAVYEASTAAPGLV
jgi:hypothetical protein